MLPRRTASVLLAAACLLAGAAIVAGCGGSGSTTSSGSTSATGRPAPPKSAFPSARGKSLAEVVEAADGPARVVVSPAAQTFYEGENRYPFGVFRRGGAQVDDAEVALYFAKVPKRKSDGAARRPGAAPESANRKAAAEALEQPAVGPFPAAIESLQTQPAFRARTTTDDPNAASVVYVTEVNFTSDGEWRVAALVKGEDGLTATLLPSASVGTFKRVPRPGRQAPRIHTPTAASANGDLSKVTTRIPPDTQNRVDYADALGREPVILLFATPQFCQSRVCGPVVDVAEQVKERYGEEAAFIHMEIFNDNDPNKGVRPQVRAFHLPSEPWLFAIDSDGAIRSAIEGAFGVKALTRAVKGVTGE
jgi:hypothetical protein